MRRFCVVVVAAALGAAAVPSSASAAVVDRCSSSADLSIGIPLPSGAVPPASPIDPGLSTGPSCSITIQGFQCAGSCQVRGTFGGTGLVAGRIRVLADNQSSFAVDCGPAINGCEVTAQFSSTSFASIDCRVKGVVAVLTGVACEVRTL